MRLESNPASGPDRLSLPGWVAAWACVVGLAIGCSAGKPTSAPVADGGSTAVGGTASAKRFVFITNGDDPFWDALLSGLKEGEQRFGCAAAGITVSRDVNNASAEGQIERLRQYATQDDIAGIAISVIQADNQSIVEEMKKLQAKGVKVITVDGDVNRSTFRDARPFYIGTDNVVGGRTLGAATRAILEAKGIEKGGYVQFAGFTDNDNARSRMDGVKETLGANYVERDRMADEMDLPRARDNVRNATQNHKDLAALVGIWAYNAPAIADVVTETGTRDKYVVATFDAADLAIGQMEKGNIDVMVVQNPFEMGVRTVRLLKALVENDEAVIKEMYPRTGQPDGDIHTTGLRVVVPNASSPVKPGLFDPNVVEYMTLPDFQAWLTKYNLTSS
ncbi:MAG: substrate-binding domain-containing protein [Planctomycetia bacterium]|nr:substrate-binding domain-containing protein [Planctomycetia bacterium]